ncbi:MAG: hypothetical protein WAM81_09640 [Acidimicrobiia bacterium]
MGHVPLLLVSIVAWEVAQRLNDGAAVSYTDGQGRPESRET